MIIRSDMFQKRLAERRASINEKLDTAVIHKAKEASVKAMDLLLERMTEQPEKMATGVILDIAEKSLQAVGYGPKNLVGQPIPQQVTVQTNVMVSREILEGARERIRSREAQTIESSVQEVQPEPEEGDLGATADDPAPGGRAAE